MTWVCAQKLLKQGERKTRAMGEILFLQRQFGPQTSKGLNWGSVKTENIKMKTLPHTHIYTERMNKRIFLCLRHNGKVRLLWRPICLFIDSLIHSFIQSCSFHFLGKGLALEIECQKTKCLLSWSLHAGGKARNKQTDKHNLCQF